MSETTPLPTLLSPSPALLVADPPLIRGGDTRPSRGPPRPRLAPARRRFHTPWLHRLIAASRTARLLSLGVLARVEIAILSGHKDADAMRLVRAARRGRESLLSGNEAFTLFAVARAQSALPGEMAEVGVYQGVSAKLISLGSDHAPLHLFDTFAGLPPPAAEESAQLKAGIYAASLASVQDFLTERRNVSFHPGLFPGTADACAEKRFSFVHLDVDLKSSTLSCLEFFYPRMLPGGVILSHDYSYLDGVRAAFDEFCAGRLERPIELATSQAMLVKL
jgi:hypothetical protein